MIDPKSKYTYDALYRLLKATGREKDSLPMPGNGGYTPDFVATDAQSSDTFRTYCQQFTYDELGNIEQLSHRATCGGTEHWKRNYQYNSNKPNNYLLSTYTGGTPPGTPEYTYDNHGNLLDMPHLSALNWDFADQLKNSEKTDEITHYVYSGGERVRKVVVDTSGTPKIKYERIYLGGYELYREYDSSENLDLERETHHIMDDQRKIALLEVKTVNNGSTIANGNRTTIARYQYTNHLDSACLELNDSAEILSYEEYHPFGTTSYSLHTNDSEVSLKRYKYVHKERDDESGLYYYGARYYAAWLCRFVSVDPLKDKYPFYSTYQYAGNKPVTFIDLDGLEEAKPKGDTTIQQKPPEEDNWLMDHGKSKHARGEVQIGEDQSTYTYTVEGGGGSMGFDTLFSIAKRFNTSVEALVEINKLENTDIQAGQKLKIPQHTSFGLSAGIDTSMALSFGSWFVNEKDHSLLYMSGAISAAQIDPQAYGTGWTRLGGPEFFGDSINLTNYSQSQALNLYLDPNEAQNFARAHGFEPATIWRITKTELDLGQSAFGGGERISHSSVSYGHERIQGFTYGKTSNMGKISNYKSHYTREGWDKLSITSYKMTLPHGQLPASHEKRTVSSTNAGQNIINLIADLIKIQW